MRLDGAIRFFRNEAGFYRTSGDQPHLQYGFVTLEKAEESHGLRAEGVRPRVIWASDGGVVKRRIPPEMRINAGYFGSLSYKFP